MGWIRKKFKQIKKKVKKLLSTKLGRIIGGIGLSMAMGWAAGKLFEGAKTLFGGVAPPTSTTPVDPTTLLTDETVKQTTRESMVETVKKAQETLSNSQKTLDFIADPKNSRLEAFKKYDDLTKAADLTGNTSDIFTNVLTDATENIVTDVSKIPSYSPEELLASGDDLFASKDSLVLKEGATLKQGMENPYKYAELPEGATIGEKFRRFAGNPLESTKDFFSQHVIPESPSELLGEGIRFGIEEGIQNYLADDELGYVGPGQVVGVQTQGSMPQNQYLTDISNQYQAAMNTTQMPTMNDVMGGAFYGNMTPQYLQNLNQQMYNTFMPLPS